MEDKLANRQLLVTIIGFVVTIGAVGLNWWLTNRTTVLNHKREKKKKLKQILFFLLEIRHHMQRGKSVEEKVHKGVVRIMEVLKTRYGIDVTEQDQALLSTGLLSTISPYLQNDDSIGKLISDVDAVILQLSEWEPFISYDLSGRHDIRRQLKLMQELLSHFAPNEEFAPAMLKGLLENFVSKDSLKTIDTSLRLIAMEIDEKTVEELETRLIAPSIEESMEELDEALPGLMDDIIQGMVQQAQFVQQQHTTTGMSS